MADDASKSLGRLTKVELREVWLNEAANFTPWLARKENLDLLGDTIGIDLVVEASEKGVGPFRADLVCRDTGADALVLIENQLERTNHTHLGQLMTYAAGLSAVTIVWVAERFTDEHRAALDWLNEVTSDQINLFGLEIELWRIGDSPIAPKFNVVSQPNDWLKAKGTGAQAELTDARVLQVEFWTAFREFVAGKASPIKTTKAHPQNWMNIAIGRAGFHMVAIASLWDAEEETSESHELRAELVMDDESADAYFLMLEADKAAIEAALGETLAWHRPENRRARKVYVRRSADLESRKDWPEYHGWLLGKLELLHGVLGPRVRALVVPPMSA